MKHEYQLYDIIIYQKIPHQLIAFFGDNRCVIQDIHTRTENTLISLIDGFGTKSDVKWFCEKTEHVNFVIPPR